MAWNLNSHARVSRRSPSAWAICDFCYDQVNRVDLSPDRQYMGTEVRPTGFLVCRRCLDRPQPQQKAILLPPDPLPVDNPRVDIAPNGNQGFTLYGLTLVQAQQGAGAGFGYFIFGVSAFGVGSGGASPYSTYPTDKVGALASLAAVSGIPTPASPNDWGTTIASVNIAQQLVPANASRSWLAIYSPGGLVFAISFGTAAFGNLSSLMIGPGECAFWANAQENGVVSTGAVSVVSLQLGAPIWAWDA